MASKEDERKMKSFFLFLNKKKHGTHEERERKIQDLKLNISSEKIKYILWSTSAVILILFLAKRIKMMK
tara:strand:+ start:1363 stop:1569 length:207 start_codon:yes stop_codon:yes gene_type:complete